MHMAGSPDSMSCGFHGSRRLNKRRRRCSFSPVTYPNTPSFGQVIQRNTELKGLPSLNFQDPERVQSGVSNCQCTAWGKNSFRIFASSAEGDFPQAFYETFSDSIPSVRPRSELKGEPTESHNRFWTFETPKQITPDSFDVYGGYYCGPLCAKHCTYRVIREGVGWRVTIPSGTCVVS
jgi:hypothetical protein